MPKSPATVAPIKASNDEGIYVRQNNDINCNTTFVTTPNSSTSSTSIAYQRWLFLPILTIVWWGASAWNSVAAKRAAKANPHCISIMAAASNWPGLIFFFIIKVWERFRAASLSKQDDMNSCSGLFAVSMQELWDIRYLSAAHVVGLYASYRGLVQGRVSLVQAVKAVEPLMAMAMSAALYRQYPGDSRIVLSAVVVVGGTICVLVEDTSFAASALLWTLTSSLATQGRNQIMKQRQKQKASRRIAESSTTPSPTNSNGNHKSFVQLENGKSVHNTPISTPTSPAMVGLLMFISTSAAAFIMNIIMLFVQTIVAVAFNEPLLHNIPLPTKEVLSAGANHFAYNLASFAVLSLVEMPATHSLANTAKRAVVIGTAAWQLQEPLTTKATYGLLLVIGGSGCYGYFSKMKGTSKIERQSSSKEHPHKHFYKMKYIKQGTLLLLAAVALFQVTSDSNFVGNFRMPQSADVVTNPGYFSNIYLTATGLEKNHTGAEDLSIATRTTDTPTNNRPCIFYSIRACLLRISHFNDDDENFTLKEQHAFMDLCVQEWLSSPLETIDKNKDIDGTSSVAAFTTGRGQLKDRLDWSLFRLNGTASAHANLRENACGPAVTVKTLIPSWGNELPLVSRRFFSGGTYLPPWYSMEPNEEKIKGGFELPLGPIRKTTSAFHLEKGFDSNLFTSVLNLGDCYNHYLISMLAGRNMTIRDRDATSKTGYPYVCVVGSVMHPTCEVIWGTGIIHESVKMVFRNPKAEVFATRGPDTLIRTPTGHNGRQVAFGDPGLLLPLIFPMPEPEGETDICLIPHYIDHDVPVFMEFQKKMKSSNASEGLTVRIVNIETCDLEAYVKKLSGCKNILSSSLHGLIFGWAYGIPGIRLQLSHNVYGGHFKFVDFYKGIGHPELYVYEYLPSSIPFRKLWEKLENTPAPSIDVEDLWNVNPFHAENLGVTRQEQLNYVRSYFNNHSEYYLHKPYTEVHLHTRPPMA